jgi:hypothetical protein
MGDLCQGAVLGREGGCRVGHNESLADVAAASRRLLSFLTFVLP